MFDFKKFSPFELVNASYTAHVLYSMCELEIFDLLSESNLTCAEVVERKSIDPKFLKSILDLCVSLELLKNTNGKYSLSRMGKVYLKKANSWQRDYLMVWGNHLGLAFKNISQSLATGDNSFRLTHGLNIWDYYTSNPSESRVFVKFMNSVTGQAHLPLIVDEMKIMNASSILDIGGGIGQFGCALANKYPNVSVTVFDQASNKATALDNINIKSNHGNCTFIEGNILSDIPVGFDLFTIKHVLHDWNDQGAGRILGLISKSMTNTSKLMIIEGLIDRDFDQDSREEIYLHLRNIEQSVWTPGKVRSTEEFNILLDEAGLEISSINNSSIFDVSFILCQKIEQK